DGDQRVPARACHEGIAGGHGVCRVGRGRGRRYGDPRHLPFRRIRQPGTPGQPRADHCRDHRAQAGDAGLTDGASMANTRRSGIRAHKAAEFGLAVPYVVGHRLNRLASAGLLPSARDRRGFQLVGVEKIAAFSESWFGMSMAIWQANLALGSSMLAMTATPWLGGPAAQAGSWARHWQSTMAAVLDKG